MCGQSGQMRSLRPFPESPQVRRRLQAKIRDAEPDDLPNPRARVEHARQERVITVTIGRGPIDRREHRLDLGEIRGTNRTRARALERHGQNALTMLNALGVLCRTVTKERVNRREPHVARGGDIVAFDVEIMKEVKHFLRAEMVHIQLGHRPLFPCGDEA